MDWFVDPGIYQQYLEFIDRFDPVIEQGPPRSGRIGQKGIMRSFDLALATIQASVTAALISIPTLFIINTILLFLGLAVSAWSIPLALIAGGMVAAFQYSPHRWSILTASLLLQAILLTSAILVTGLFTDIWYDSRVYHGPAIIMLSDGWNSVYDALRLPVAEVGLRGDLFMHHYPRANWIISAALYSGLGNLDQACSFNLLLALLSLFVVRRYISVYSTISPAMAWLIAVVVAANPVVLAQIFSGYLDGVLSSTLVILIFSMLHYVETRSSLSLLTGLLYLVLMVNLKFTGVVYAAVILIAIGGYHVVRFGVFPRKSCLQCLVTGIVAMTFFGYSPYVVNTIEHGSPFYPAYGGENSKDLLVAQADPEFLELTRLEQLAIANFAVASGDFQSRPKLVAPFTVRWFFTSVDARYSGFGPFFGFVFLVSLPLVLILRRSALWIMAVGVFVSVLSTSAAWWARLAPQLWLVPLLLVMAAWSLTSSRVIRAYCLAIVGLLALDAFLVGDSVWSLQRKARQELNTVTHMHITGATITEPSFGFYSVRRLRDFGVDVSVVDRCEGSGPPVTHWVLRGLELCVDR